MQTQTYDLSITPNHSIVKVHASQWDEGERQFVFNLYNDSGLYEIPTGATIEIRGTKADGHGIAISTSTNPNDVSYSGSTVTVKTTKQMCACAGEQDFKINVHSGNKLLASARYTLVVDEDTLTPNTDISDSDIPVIIELAEEQLRQATMQAQLSKSYAQGNSESGRTGENTDNAKYYSEQATTSATNAATSAGNASTSATNAATSATNAGNSATSASGSATSAGNSATSALDSARKAQSYATGDAVDGEGNPYRTGQATDNSKYYCEQAQEAAQGMGAVDFTGATSSSDGAHGLVPKPLIADKDKFLKGDGSWESIASANDFTGATSQSAGVHGLVPAPVIADKDKYLKGDGSWGAIDAQDFTGSTSSANGTHGFVPAPSAGDEGKFLKGNGSWATVPDPQTMTGATSSADGEGGLVPKPSAGDQDKFLAGDGTYKQDARVGALSSLNTTQKNTLVDAINEVDSHTDTNTANIGTLGNLTTTAQTNLVEAINEVDSHADANATAIAKCETLVLSASSVSALPYTFSNAAIETDMVCINSELSNPAVQLSDWTVNTDTAGSCVVSGTISGTTDIKLYLMKSR